MGIFSLKGVITHSHPASQPQECDRESCECEVGYENATTYECPHCQKPEKQEWEGELYKIRKLQHEGNCSYWLRDKCDCEVIKEFKSFIRQLLYQQKTEIAKRIKKKKGTQSNMVWEQNQIWRMGYESALDDILAILEDRE